MSAPVSDRPVGDLVPSQAGDDDMKYAILGDIHANLDALTAVLADSKKEGVTHYVSILERVR